jgi:CHAD domain-containing protein
MLFLSKNSLFSSLIISVIVSLGGGGGSFAEASPVTACELMISASPSEDVAIRELPQSIDFSLSEAESRQYFDLAATLYQKHVNLSAVSTYLKEIDKGSISQLSENEITQLKSIRKYSSVMRNGFLIFDASHEVPKVFDRFVTDLGHLNDEIGLNDTKAAQKQARELLDDVDALRDFNLSSKFKPAKRSSSTEHLNDQVKVIQKYLGNKKVKADQFHRVRKIVKELMNTYLFKTSVETDSGTLASDRKVYSFLFMLNDDMGLVHDDLIAKSHNGKIDYDDYELSVPRRIRNEIKALLDRIDS